MEASIKTGVIGVSGGLGLHGLKAFLASVCVVASAASLGACATVEVYKPPVSAEISLTEKQSDLRKAADAYCEQARKKGWASGETGIGGIADLLTGKDQNANPYWKRIKADENAPASVVVRVRADAKDVTTGLDRLSLLAQGLMSSAKPTKEDVTQFELALIHARQARDSFSDALSQANRRMLSAAEVDPNAELGPLDRAVTRARMMADDLAAARTSEGVAGQGLPPPVSR